MRLTLKQVRLLKGKSQSDLAGALAIHVQTYRKIEKNPGKATIRQAKILSEILEYDYDSIFFYL